MGCLVTAGFMFCHKTVSSQDRFVTTLCVETILWRTNFVTSDLEPCIIIAILFLFNDFAVIQVESGAFTHFERGDPACFPVSNWRILHTKVKGRCWCSITVNFRGGRFSSVLENQMQIWSTNFGVWPVTSHWLLPGKYGIAWAIRLHRTPPQYDQGSLREDLAVVYSRLDATLS